jgi:hypothetical protein
MKKTKNNNTFKIYRLLLSLYPKSYLKDYKILMEQTFRDMLKENGNIFNIWFRILKELPGSLFKEHLYNIKNGDKTMITEINPKSKIYLSTIVIFWITFSLFILVTAGMFLYVVPYIGIITGIYLRAVISIIGIALIILAVKATLSKTAKVFFILTGASALGMGLSAFLHNLVYALLIKIFGEGIWANIGDEPAFFILATIVCPIALLVGVIGSIVLIKKKKVIAY